MENEFIIQRRSMFRTGQCAPASVESIVLSLGIYDYRQRDMLSCTKKKRWGTQPTEIVDMFKQVVPDSHIVAKQNFKFSDLDELLGRTEKVGVIVDITDKLKRYDKKLRRKVPDGKVDGHYIVIAGIVEKDGKKYAIFVDSSKDEIVQPQDGVIVLSENIYLVSQELFESMWEDKNINNTDNVRWACVVLYPEDDPKILNKYRV